MPPELPDLKMGFRDIDSLRPLPYQCNAVSIDVVVLIDMVFIPELLRLQTRYQTDVAIELLRQSLYEVWNDLIQYG